MAATTWAALRNLFVVRYDDFYLRLRRRLGSGDLARETLHETYMQLNRSDEMVHVQRPDAYLFRIALNVAAMRRRLETRRADPMEIEAAMDSVDESANIDRMVEARFEIEALERAIEELPPRRRTIFLAARVQELPIQTIAKSLGVSSRLVEKELRLALEHCAERLQRPSIKRSQNRTPKASRSSRGGQ